MRRNYSRLHLPKDYRFRSPLEEYRSSRDFGIEDAESSAGNDVDAESSGEIGVWESLEEQLELKRMERCEKFKDRSEKRRWRPCITIAVVSVWAAWFLVGLARLVLVGDSLVLASSTAMSVPLVIIVRYYFMDD
jgi:hypothetical protein